MIGILFNKEGGLTDFYNLNHIKIYDKKDSFEAVKIIENINLDTSNLALFRSCLNELLNQLKECKVLVGTVVIGIPFYFFNQNGIEICEAEFFSEKLLEQIYEDYILLPLEQKSKMNDNEGQALGEKALGIPTEPTAVNDEGEYFLDFIELQKYRPDISSKKALIPFFYNTLFQKLTIVCSHVMPWLDVFLEQRNLICDIKHEKNKYILEITHKICRE